jgi:hypothetical protein
MVILSGCGTDENRHSMMSPSTSTDAAITENLDYGRFRATADAVPGSGVSVKTSAIT